jgi:hypothetical protein
MATTFDGTNAVTTTNADAFIPEIWSDEIVAAYKKNLVAANLIKKMSHRGKKGDTVHIPSPTRGNASLKVAANAVTLIANVDTDIPVSINKHYEYSRLIEDIVAAQALNSLRSFYTEDAGYALGKQVDSDIIKLGRTVQGGAGARYAGAFIGSDGTTAYDYTTDNQAALTDAAIRRTIQRLDDVDTPMDNRFFIIPPSSRNTLMGLSRYTEQAFVGEAGQGNTIRNGEVGSLYGVSVFVSSNADTPNDANNGSGTAQPARVCLMAHRDAFVLVEQMGVRSQTQYQQQFLANLFTADTLYGVAELRDDGAVALVVPA